MNLNWPRSSYISLQNVKYATIRYNCCNCYNILFIPGEIKNIFLFAAGWQRKQSYIFFWPNGKFSNFEIIFRRVVQQEKSGNAVKCWLHFWWGTSQRPEQVHWRANYYSNWLKMRSRGLNMRPWGLNCYPSGWDRYPRGLIRYPWGTLEGQLLF